MLDYPAVCAYMNKHGYLGHLIRAKVTKLTADEAVTLTRDILGKRTKVRVKLIRRSWAHISDGSVSLSCDRDRRVKLSSVLHEAAHILDYRKGPKLGASSHGEPFKRTYARLLAEYAPLS